MPVQGPRLPVQALRHDLARGAPEPRRPKRKTRPLEQWASVRVGLLGGFLGLFGLPFFLQRQRRFFLLFLLGVVTLCHGPILRLRRQTPRRLRAAIIHTLRPKDSRSRLPCQSGWPSAEKEKRDGPQAVSFPVMNALRRSLSSLCRQAARWSSAGAPPGGWWRCLRSPPRSWRSCGGAVRGRRP